MDNSVQLFKIEQIKVATRLAQNTKQNSSYNYFTVTESCNYFTVTESCDENFRSHRHPVDGAERSC